MLNITTENKLGSDCSGVDGASNRTLTLTNTGATAQPGFTVSAGGAGLLGDLDINGTLSIIGQGAGRTIIDASALGDRIFDMDLGDNFTLSNLTLTGGNVAGSGGAIRNTRGILTVNESFIVLKAAPSILSCNG